MEKLETYLTLFNQLDEQGRFRGFYFAESTSPIQQDTHGYSYLQLKKNYLEIEELSLCHN